MSRAIANNGSDISMAVTGMWSPIRKCRVLMYRGDALKEAAPPYSIDGLTILQFTRSSQLLRHFHTASEMHEALPGDSSKLLSLGATGFAGVVDDELAVTGYVARQAHWDVTEVGITINLDPLSELVMASFAVVPSMRRRGIYTAFLGLLRARFSTSAMIIYADPANAPSCRGIEKSGFVCVGSLKSIRLGAMHFFVEPARHVSSQGSPIGIVAR